jgi:hypothetical protein
MSLLRTFALLLLALTLIAGCNPAADNPGTWNPAKIQEHLKKSLKLSEATVSPAEGGGFSATGKNAEGESFKITIKQDAAKKRIEWKSEGDRGSFEDGYYEIQ